MEFRDAVSVLVEAAGKRLDELFDLIDMASRDREDPEITVAYTEEQREIEEAIAAGRRYLEKTPA